MREQEHERDVEQFCHLNRARAERGRPSTAFEAGLFCCEKNMACWVMAQVELDTEEIIVLYVYAKQSYT